MPGWHEDSSLFPLLFIAGPPVVVVDKADAHTNYINKAPNIDRYEFYWACCSVLGPLNYILEHN